MMRKFQESVKALKADIEHANALVLAGLRRVGDLDTDGLNKFRKAQDLSEVDTERDLECGICLEVNRKVVLPDCAHTLCMRCFQDWRKSKSCPFCRACLEKVRPGSLWTFTDDSDIVDMDTLTRENIRRLFMYINKLPLVVLHVVDNDIYEFRIKL